MSFIHYFLTKDNIISAKIDLFEILMLMNKKVWLNHNYCTELDLNFELRKILLIMW